MTLENIALTGRVLGVLLYAPPESEDGQQLLATLSESEWVKEWPYGDAEQLQTAAALIATGIEDEQEESLAEAYQRLFVGPDTLPAPLWGSVYLDKENVLFGNSTLRLRRWLRSNGIDAQHDRNEPEDHIGTLLMMVAWLAEERQGGLVEQLLTKHLLPWAPRYLELLQANAQHPFYQGLAQLAQITLSAWAAECSAEVETLELHF
ncbi:Tat proofreading chaperone DmsD [Serratia proteamaculans]|jgi:TorA maturation chaperone TorD|uniref:Tat proofreading chaperone DmsD n=1 Tax=Serratia TaxID=613 RepID=UPI0010765A7C|nr:MULTISPECIES: Tat proofreading chaperone DmsD [Serratia]NTX78045.1 Tat proofreading chaperone DmsD [Serratia proteamaculans]NTZ27713.1 Tat proofreading chaperone DmsD [Serratia proteamaculans]TFZ52211.1 Tat proofreading chaperone DmsD [Serratia proteamaculans]CAI0738658.1 Twin-arginine leader-binding protein DmsD [Serratia quinivorans]CAI0793087.1 Twin-arginine leader-binding protein DmsD [Serratia quinivorans]